MRKLAVVRAGFITSSLSAISYSEMSEMSVLARPGKRMVRCDVIAEGSSSVSIPLLRASALSGVLVVFAVWSFRV